MRINAEKKEERERVALSLLRSTLELAAAHGFSSLGLREVSRAAGIAPTSFYRHFVDMEELGLALIETLVGQLVQRLSAPKGPAETASTVEVIVNRTLAAATEDAELFRFILAERVGAVASFRAALSRQLGIVSEALLQGEKAHTAHDEGAFVVLLFDACGDLLDNGLDRLPSVREGLERQAKALLLQAPEARSAS